jgi:hypothetical protein
MLKMLRQLKEWQQKVKRGGVSPVDNPTHHMEREVSVRATSFCIGRPVDTKNFVFILYYHFKVFKRYLHKMLLIVLELRSWFSGF